MEEALSPGAIPRALISELNLDSGDLNASRHGISHEQMEILCSLGRATSEHKYAVASAVFSNITKSHRTRFGHAGIVEKIGKLIVQFLGVRTSKSIFANFRLLAFYLPTS